MRLLRALGCGEVLRHVTNEWNRAGGYGHISLEHVFEILRGSIEDFGVVLVLRYTGAVEADASKEALVARVAEQFRVHLPIGGGLARAAHRSGSGGGIW